MTARKPATQPAETAEAEEAQDTSSELAETATVEQDEPETDETPEYRLAEYGLTGQALLNAISEAAARADTPALGAWDGFQAALTDCYPVLVHVETGQSYPCTESVVERVVENWYRLADMRTFAGSRAAA